MYQLRKYYEQHPLRVILLAGLLIRLFASVFSKGFGWIDDQFLVIEIAQSWVDGTDYYQWLPGTPGNEGPVGFSFFYTGLHYLLFSFLEWIGIIEPQTKMIVVRLLHGVWSMLIIFFGFRIAQHISDEKTAKNVGWVLSLLWLFPFLSVHNLVEFVSIPFLVWGIFLILKSTDQSKLFRWLFIGFLFGMAFNIRFQTILITGGVGLVLLYERKWKETFFVASGVLSAILVVQGGVDMVIWGQPFAQLLKYITYNAAHSGDYTLGPWYVYFLFLLGALVPPVSFFIFTGYFYAWRKILILFLPTLLFLVFHSVYPNKQERFITTIIPFLIITGLIGWQWFCECRKNKIFLFRFTQRTWVLFWIINLILLIPVSVMYSKKARVESMVYLSRYENLHYFVIEDVNKDVLRFPPMFYLEKWIHYDAIMQKDSLNELIISKNWKQNENQPGFVLFFEPNNIDSRVDSMLKVFPQLVFEKLIEPGYLDKVLHWLNPINDNQNIYIYRNKAVLPDAIILENE